MSNELIYLNVMLLGILDLIAIGFCIAWVILENKRLDSESRFMDEFYNQFHLILDKASKELDEVKK